MSGVSCSSSLCPARHLRAIRLAKLISVTSLVREVTDARNISGRAVGEGWHRQDAVADDHGRGGVPRRAVHVARRHRPRAQPLQPVQRAPTLHRPGIGLRTGWRHLGEGDADNGAKRILDEILATPWPGIELLPAGASLTGISQVAIADTWLLRDIITAAGLPERYDLILIDTGGRTGSLVTLAMYAADVAYAPIAPTTDAVRKATEAQARVDRIQRAHPLRWAGVVLSGFDGRVGIEEAIREKVYEEFGDDVRAEVPRRASVNEAFQLGDRLGDRTDVAATGLARIFLGFLLRDLMQRPELPHRGPGDRCHPMSPTPKAQRLRDRLSINPDELPAPPPRPMPTSAPTPARRATDRIRRAAGRPRAVTAAGARYAAARLPRSPPEHPTAGARERRRRPQHHPRAQGLPQLLHRGRHLRPVPRGDLLARPP